MYFIAHGKLFKETKEIVRLNFVENSIQNSIKSKSSCPICRRRIVPSTLKKAFLTSSSTIKDPESLQKVSEKSEIFQDRLELVKKQFEQYNQRTEEGQIDLQDILKVLNNEIDLFEEMKDINNNLEVILDDRNRLLQKNFAKMKKKYEQTSHIRTENVNEIAVDIQSETEIAQQFQEKKVKEWKEALLHLLKSNQDRCELEIKIGDEPRRYIKEIFENQINRLNGI